MQYKPHASNDIDSIRRRTQRECGGLFPKNIIKRKQCFEDHIGNYEHRLLADLSVDLFNEELEAVNEKPVDVKENDGDFSDDKALAQVNLISDEEDSTKEYVESKNADSDDTDDLD